MPCLPKRKCYTPLKSAKSDRSAPNLDKSDSHRCYQQYYYFSAIISAAIISIPLVNIGCISSLIRQCRKCKSTLTEVILTVHIIVINGAKLRKAKDGNLFDSVSPRVAESSIYDDVCGENDDNADDQMDIDTFPQCFVITFNYYQIPFMISLLLPIFSGVRPKNCTDVQGDIILELCTIRIPS